MRPRRHDRRRQLFRRYGPRDDRLRRRRYADTQSAVVRSSRPRPLVTSRRPPAHHAAGRCWPAAPALIEITGR